MSISSEIKLVLFDLDETLFDHAYSSKCAKNAVYSAYACFAPRSMDEFERDTSVHLDKLWPQIVQRTMTIEARIAESVRRLSAQYGLAPDAVDCAGAAQLYRQTYQQSRQPIA